MNRITKICVVALIALASTFQGFAQDSPLKGKKVLYIFGGWDGHEPVQCRDIFVPWMESEGAEVLVYDNLDPYTDTTIMNHVDLIIQQWTMGTITRQQEPTPFAAEWVWPDGTAARVTLSVRTSSSSTWSAASGSPTRAA